tara:strand:+ start:11179 stop:11400 length:222 start_codon:yes stop_codon:yes gene_type:complete
MKKAEEVLDVLYNFTQTQKMEFDGIISQLASIKEKKISRDVLDTLTNCFRQIDGLRENIISRLISSMKRGDIV